MSMRVTCPHCQTSLKVPDQAIGRNVKCPKCTTAFAVPDPAVPAIRSSQAPPLPEVHPAVPPLLMDEDYEQVPRSRREFADIATPPNTGAQFGLGIASLVVGIIGLLIALVPCIGLIVGLPIAVIGLVLGVAALIVGFARGGQGMAFPISGSAVSLVAVIVPIIWWYVWVRPALQTAGARAQQGLQQVAQKMQEEVRKAQQAQAEMNRWQPGVGGVQLVLNQQDRLTDADPKDKSRNTPSKTYNIKMQAGRSYQFQMDSKEFDCYMRLEDANGVHLVVSFAGGFGIECRITYFCPRDGDYRIIATRANDLRARTGNFQLTMLQK